MEKCTFNQSFDLELLFLKKILVNPIFQLSKPFQRNKSEKLQHKGCVPSIQSISSKVKLHITD